MEKEGIDYFNPAIVMAFLIAGMSDAAFITLPFWFIPIVGLIILALVIGFHYFASFFLLFLVFPKIRGFLPKILLIIALILPLPTLSLGILLAIILQNKIIEQLAIQAVAIVTAGAGEALEAGALAETGAEAAEAAIETVEAGAEATETAEGVETVEAGTEAGKIGKGGKEALKGKPSGQPEQEVPEGKPSEQPEPEKPEISPEALGEEPTEFEKLQKLLKETPEPKEKAEEDEEEEELPKAA